MVFTKRDALDMARFATDILGKLPRPGDSLIEVGIKAIAMFDSYHKSFSKEGAKHNMLARYRAVEKESATFVGLFFGTAMASQHTISRIYLSDYSELIQAVDKRGEALFFLEYHYGGADISNRFFHTPGYDFSVAVEALWSAYPHGMFIARSEEERERKVICSPCKPPSLSLVTTEAKGRVDTFRKHMVGTTAILFGPAGTGKSSFAVHVAGAEGRLLKLDASTVPSMSLQEIDLLFETTKPRVVLIDDMDRAPMATTRSRLLYVLEHIRRAYPAMHLLITVNDPTKLDPAVYRSERIDTVPSP